MGFQTFHMRTVRNDISYALRQLRYSPIYTATAMLTLALGIGATTAIFSLIHTVMLQSLPVVDPSTLYRIGDGRDCCDEGTPQNNWGLYSYPLFLRLQASAPEFEQMTAFEAGRSIFSVRRGNSNHAAVPLTSEYVTANYFDTFGIRALAGRTIQPSDDRPSSVPVAVLSYRAWQREYGSDIGVIGSTFIIAGHSFTIVGVTPPGFFGETLSSDPPDLWVPLQQKPVIAGKDSILMHPAYEAWLRVIGRLKPGASASALPARLSGVLRQWLRYDAEWPPAYLPQQAGLLPHQNIKIVPAGSGVNSMKEDYGDSLRILLAVCCLVLLIACANIANLLLARGTARRAQTSMRLALGASRGRLIQQSLTESLVLSLSGGVAGIVVAYLGVKVIVALAFPNVHAVPISAAPSLPVLAFAFGLSVITAALFGTIPAYLASRAEPLEALRGANRTTRERSSLPQKVSVILQATLSITLVFGAGLLVRSLEKLQHQDFGYNLDRLISIRIAALPSTYSPTKLDALYNELQSRLSAIPGIKSAVLAQYTPFLDQRAEFVIREGQGTPDVNSDAYSSLDYVTPDYLGAMGQKILRGRGLTNHDTSSTRNVAVVDENFVQRFFKPSENPLGTHFGLFDPKYSTTYEIVGVVSSANYFDSVGGSHDPIFFSSLAQHVQYDDGTMQQLDRDVHVVESAVLQTRSDRLNLEPQIRHILPEVDPNLTILKIQTMRDQVETNFAQPRLVAQMTSLFGILALFLAAVGLYGVTAYTVALRTNEIGVRMALGSSRGQVVRLVLRGAFLQISVGLIIGIPIAIACGHLIAAQLYHVKSWDPFVLVGSMAALGACAFIASIIPAQRAAWINPVTALRAE